MKPAFKENNIPIICCSDNNYVPYLTIMICSLTSNVSNIYNYDIIILEDKVSENNKNIIKKNERENVSIRFFDMSGYLEKKRMILKKPTQTKWSVTIYYRMFIPYILMQYKKVIYLDSDIINLSDIAQMYYIDIQENLVGATRLCGRVVAESTDMFTQSYVYHHLILPELNGNDYFNSGVLLINSEAFRRTYSETFIFQFINEQEYRMPDQDSLNILCAKKVKYIDSGWNWQPYTQKEFSNILCLLSSEKKEYFLEGYLNQKNIHYTIPVKPWKEPYGTYAFVASYFLQYASTTLFWKDILNEIREYQKYKIDFIALAKRTWKELEEYAINHKVYLYGFGMKGKEFLRMHSEIPIAGIIDRDSDKRNVNYSVPFVDLEMLSEKDVGIIVSNDKYEDIIKSLKCQGFGNFFSYKCLEKKEIYAWQLEVKDLKKARCAVDLLCELKSKEIFWDIIYKREQMLFDRNVKYVDIYEGKTYFRDDVYSITNNEIYVDIGRDSVLTIEKFKRYVNHKYKSLFLVEESKIKEIKRCYNPINNKFTFIKINVFSTMKILKELEEIIKDSRPKLAICVSNNYADLWEIPIYLKHIVEDYKLYLRHHSPTTYLSVIYATC